MSRVKNILKGIALSKRVAGAYLFVGPPGVGKRDAAEYFADQLGCKKQDRIFVAPTGASFKIEQVRDMQTWVRYGPSAGDYLLAVVEKADTLTDQAAAAFLKTLEEPAPGVVFVLLTEREDKMLPTIISRCQRLLFSEVVAEWQPRPELSQFYADFKKIKTVGRLKQLELSARLLKEKEKIEEILYDLLFFARFELFDVKMSRVLMEAIRFVKRKASLRLALDVMCLKLGENSD
jgi:DNA polymerase III delta prime subunit